MEEIVLPSYWLREMRSWMSNYLLEGEEILEEHTTNSWRENSKRTKDLIKEEELESVATILIYKEFSRSFC